MRYNRYGHMGRHIGRAVRDAVRSGNFGQAGRVIEDSLHDVADSVNDTFDNLHRGFSGSGPGSYAPRYAQETPARQKPASVFRSPMPGSVSGVLCAVFGFLMGIPLLIADVSIIGTMLAGYLPFRAGLAGLLVVSVLTVLSLWLAAYGTHIRARAKRFVRYRGALGGLAFGTVEKLAAAAGQPLERARKDLRQMIETGACIHGHLDTRETCFMVDDDTYQEYLDAERAYLAREQEKAAQQKEKTQQQEQQRQNPQAAELAAAQKEGEDYLRQIRAANDALPGEEISQSLDTLESVTRRIFVCVEQHPEKLGEIRRFMRYYLPTTLKLVKAYEEFESQPVRGENIRKAEGEIQQALGTINTAFGNLLDTLYANEAFDISTDISALETMLKQEGLTGSDFAQAPKDGGLS